MLVASLFNIVFFDLLVFVLCPVHSGLSILDDPSVFSNVYLVCPTKLSVTCGRSVVVSGVLLYPPTITLILTTTI